LSTIKDRLGQLTNFGLRVLYKDALDRLAVKRALYGDALIETNRRLLELSGAGPDRQTALHWPDPLPENAVELRQAAKLDQELDIASKETIAATLGYDWAVEQERKAAEATQEGDVGTAILRAFERGGAL
jgi:hypothetical protein